jgi:hypothetical protein
MATEPGPLLPEVGRVTKANARQKLSEQLAAVAAVVPLYEGSQPDATERHRTELAIEGIQAADLAKFALSYNLWRTPAPERVTGHLDHWLSELSTNLKNISAKLPDVESYTVQVGFPLGVSVSVTFSAGDGKRTARTTPRQGASSSSGTSRPSVPAAHGSSQQQQEREDQSN